MQRINKTKSLFFEKINKIHKPLAKLNGKETVSKPRNKTRNENGDITIETGVSKIIRSHFKNLYLQTGKSKLNGWFSKQIPHT